ncbi:Uncharacterised protein [Serratia fonticola]|uniref:helix-turn-helix transcriptional regulator n=1 Tax=Serratia fonticola TaxID=47917 RepID=UPI002183A29D|nr:helix-turn-helix transcriptional regulator [Serratia fonticola]CAI2492312.1 Uncharacterised protein [Serratia fonticola]
MKSNTPVLPWNQQESLVGVEHFGKRLKQAIGNELIASFARKCEISEASVRKYLKGGMLPGIDIAEKISANTGRSLTWLITGEGEEYKDKQSQDTNRLSDEEIAKWLGCIADALTADDKIRIVAAFKQGGLSALFKPELITSTQNKPKGR